MCCLAHTFRQEKCSNLSVSMTPATLRAFYSHKLVRGAFTDAERVALDQLIWPPVLCNEQTRSISFERMVGAQLAVNVLCHLELGKAPGGIIRVNELFRRHTSAGGYLHPDLAWKEVR